MSKDIIRNDSDFVRYVILESSNNTSSNLELFLNECLTIGRNEARITFLLTETDQQKELPLGKEGQSNLDVVVLGILKKYDPSVKVPSQQTLKQVEQTRNILSNLVGNMLTKLEKTSNKFVGKLQPEELKKTFDSTLKKIKPVLDDSYQADTVKKYFDFLVQKNPKYASIIVGMLINGAKISVSADGYPAVGALGAGIIVGMILRTIVGRMKNPKEDWKTAAKNAAKVTSISLLSGAAIKGIFNIFSENGFLSGVKSYFSGTESGVEVTLEKLQHVFDKLKISPGAPPHSYLEQVVGKENYDKIINAMAINKSLNAKGAAERKLDSILTNYQVGHNSSYVQQLVQILNQKGVKLNL